MADNRSNMFVVGQRSRTKGSRRTAISRGAPPSYSNDRSPTLGLGSPHELGPPEHETEVESSRCVEL